MLSLSTLLHGTLYEKLMWTFRMYDLDGDGVITKEELGNVVVGIYELMGIVLLPPVRTCKLNSQAEYEDMFVQTGSLCSLDYLPRRRESVMVDKSSKYSSSILTHHPLLLDAFLTGGKA